MSGNFGVSQVSFEVRCLLSDTRQGLEKLIQHFPSNELKAALFTLYELEATAELESKDEHEMYLGAW